MRRGRIICFFYMDNIVFAFQKKDTQNVNEAVLEMRNHFKLNKLGELK